MSMSGSSKVGVRRGVSVSISSTIPCVVFPIVRSPIISDLVVCCPTTSSLTAKSLHKLVGTLSSSFSAFTGDPLPRNTGKAIEADDLRNIDETLLDARFRVLVGDADLLVGDAGRAFFSFWGDREDEGEKDDCGSGGEDVFLVFTFWGDREDEEEKDDCGSGGEDVFLVVLAFPLAGAGAFGISRSGFKRCVTFLSVDARLNFILSTLYFLSLSGLRSCSYSCSLFARVLGSWCLVSRSLTFSLFSSCSLTVTVPF